MKNKFRKVYYFLTQLSSNELDRFEAYLRSHAFSENRIGARILTLYRERILPDSKGEFSAAEFHATLYPDKPIRSYSEGGFRRLMSDFLSRLIEFQALSELRRDPVQIKIDWLKILEEKGDRYYLNESVKAFKQLDKRLEDGTSLMQHFELERSRNVYYAHYEPSRGDMNLTPTLKALDHYFILEKLTYACVALNQDLIVHRVRKHQIEFIEPVLKYVQQNWETVPALIQMYYSVYIMLSPGTLTEENFYSCKACIQNNQSVIAHNEVRDLYRYLANYCNNRINQGSRKFNKIAIDLYHHILSEDYFSENGKVPHKILTNLITLLVLEDKPELALEQLENYREKLPEKESVAVYAYNRAKIFFRNEDYGHAAGMLARNAKEFQGSEYETGMKVLTVKARWLGEDYEEVERLCQRFSKESNPSDGLFNQAARPFFSILGKVANAMFDLSEQRKKRLQEQLKRTDLIGSRNLRSWINEMINEQLN